MKLAATDKQLFVDTSFWGGVVPGNTNSLEDMIDAGVRGFKCFLIHSGIDDFPNVSESDLRLAMPVLARRRLPLLVHAELECGESKNWQGAPYSYKAFLDSRPRRWENEAVKLMISLCREYNCPVHIVHLSSSEAVPLIKAAKDAGLPVSAETCPHYLTFAAEEIADGDPRFKCAPPIREAENREHLWRALEDGTIDFIVSDHSPCLPELKHLADGDLKKAWGGISSLQFGLSSVWTEAKKRGASLSDVSKWMSERTAQFLQLADRKGLLLPGYDADIVVWSAEESQIIEESGIHHRHKVTPYDGRKLLGVVKQTYVRGEKVFDNGQFASEPKGQQIVTSRSESRR
jgi:allantoinase